MKSNVLLKLGVGLLFVLIVGNFMVKLFGSNTPTVDTSSDSPVSVSDTPTPSYSFEILNHDNKNVYIFISKARKR